MSSLRDLQRSLAYSAEQVRSRDKRISELEEELKNRDITIRTIQSEIDKFKQIIEPVTKQSLVNLSIQSLVVDDKKGAGKLSPGRDGDRYVPLESSTSTLAGLNPSEGSGDESSGSARTKRFAISAEPSTIQNPENAIIEKFPKGLE